MLKAFVTRGTWMYKHSLAASLSFILSNKGTRNTDGLFVDSCSAFA